MVVALAGHGVQFQNDTASYFCASDAKVNDKTTLISLDEIYKELDKSGAGLKLLLVDACRNDPLSDNSRVRSTVRLESVTRPQKEPPGGVMAPFSCSKGEKAFEHTSLRHGVFFYYVIEALSGKADYDKDENVVVDEISLFTRQRVSDFVRSRFGAAPDAGTDGQGAGTDAPDRGPAPRPLVATSMTVKLKPIMGVATADLTLEEKRRLGLDESTKGVLIKSVLLASPGDQAGLQPDDVITWFDGIPFDDRVAYLSPGSHNARLASRMPSSFSARVMSRRLCSPPPRARSSPITCIKSTRRMRKRTCDAVLPSSSSTNSTRPLPTSTRQSDSTHDSPPPTNIGG